MGNLMDTFDVEYLEQLDLKPEQPASCLLLSFLIRTDHVRLEDREIQEFLDNFTDDRMLLWQFVGQDDTFDYNFVWYNDQDQIFEINKVIGADGDPTVERLYNLDASSMHKAEFYRTVAFFDTIEYNRLLPTLSDILRLAMKLDVPE